MNFRNIIFTIFLSAIFSKSTCFQNPKSSIEEISDAKDFKKLLRTKNNVLACFISSQKEASSILKVFRETADAVKGEGTLVLVDCSGEGKKLCKKSKASPQPFVLRHYQNGEFHKTYDRKETSASMINFMRNPTGEVPWEEEDATDVIHLLDPSSMYRLLKKESKPVMVMYYAPWCGFCKMLKPEYNAAAAELKRTHVMAAIDVNRPENLAIRMKFNISGFPTLLYFQNGEVKHTYEGRNKKDDLIKFMKDPKGFQVEPKEDAWSENESDVVHLTSANFEETLKNEKSALVMFYAPWCGHCKKMKPEYEKAAKKMKAIKAKGILAAVDATKEQSIGKQFGVKGFPTIKYFKFGEHQWDTPQLRESSAIVDFMKDPKEPPPPPPPEPSWEEVQSEVVHLNVEGFKPFLRKKKHALVMFYAPWCGHCKMAKPEFQDAAVQFKEEHRVAFAAVDCTKHSSVCQTFGINGYPTIKYFSYYNKETKDYSGGRKKKDFVAFMNNVSQGGKVKEEL